MENKRGQISVFISIAIFLLLLFALAIFIKNKIDESTIERGVEEIGYPTDVQPITNFVEQCLEEIAPPGIYLAGAQGGYIEPPIINSLVSENQTIAYAHKNSQFILLRDEMENQISKFIEDSITECTQGFIDFEEFQINQSEPTAETIIAEENVLIKLTYPLRITKENKKYNIKDFRANIPIRFGYLLSIARDITEKQSDDFLLDFTYLSYFDVYITVFPYDENTIIYAINDPNSVIDDAPFNFVFAMETKSNHAPEIEYITDFVLAVGDDFRYQVEVSDEENDKMFFSSDSSLFTINRATGLITARPQETGEYQVKIRVEDIKGASSEQTFRVVVENE